MSNNPEARSSSGGDFLYQTSHDFTTSNVAVHRIEIIEDRVRLILGDHIKEIKSIDKWKNKWIAPFTFFLSILIVFPTSDFNEWGLSSEIWCGFFIFIDAVAFGLSVYFGIKELFTKTISERELIDSIVYDFRNYSVGTPTTTSSDTSATNQP